MRSPTCMRLGQFSLLLLALGMLVGCPANTPREGDLINSTGSSADSASSPSATAPAVGMGWPVGDDPQASGNELAQHIHNYFTDHHGLRYADIYPRGWSRVQWKPQGEATAVVQQATADAPQQVEISLVTLKHFSPLHEEQAAAAADQRLFALNPAPTVEAMHTLANPETKPVKLTIEYEDQDGTWRRTSWHTEPVGKEPRTWLDELEQFP